MELGSATEHEVVARIAWASAASTPEALKLPTRAEKLIGATAAAAWDEVLSRVCELARASGPRPASGQRAAQLLCTEFRPQGFAAAWKQNGQLKLVWREGGVPVPSNEIQGVVMRTETQHARLSRTRVTTSRFGVSCTLVCRPGLIRLPRQTSWDNPGSALAQRVSAQEWNSVLATLAVFAENMDRKSSGGKRQASKIAQTKLRQLLPQARVHVGYSSVKRYEVVLIFDNKIRSANAQTAVAVAHALAPDSEMLCAVESRGEIPQAVPVAAVLQR